ncbi:MAG: hypothetical protein BWX70_03066 [Verrucomicrobia bacterium ADurb.Bin070]|nr:MAG: hypothetical protein BWX70_03066 [Verrucomicrobia bacterium ADurb.Bin070]
MGEREGGADQRGVARRGAVRSGDRGRRAESRDGRLGLPESDGEQLSGPQPCPVGGGGRERDGRVDPQPQSEPHGHAGRTQPYSLLATAGRCVVGGGLCGGESGDDHLSRSGLQRYAGHAGLFHGRGRRPRDAGRSGTVRLRVQRQPVGAVRAADERRCTGHPAVCAVSARRFAAGGVVPGRQDRVSQGAGSGGPGGGGRGRDRQRGAGFQADDRAGRAVGGRVAGRRGEGGGRPRSAHSELRSESGRVEQGRAAAGGCFAGARLQRRVRRGRAAAPGLHQGGGGTGHERRAGLRGCGFVRAGSSGGL